MDQWQRTVRQVQKFHASRRYAPAGNRYCRRHRDGASRAVYGRFVCVGNGPIPKRQLAARNARSGAFLLVAAKAFAKRIAEFRLGSAEPRVIAAGAGAGEPRIQGRGTPRGQESRIDTGRVGRRLEPGFARQRAGTSAAESASTPCTQWRHLRHRSLPEPCNRSLRGQTREGETLQERRNIAQLSPPRERPYQSFGSNCRISKFTANAPESRTPDAFSTVKRSAACSK